VKQKSSFSNKAYWDNFVDENFDNMVKLLQEELESTDANEVMRVILDKIDKLQKQFQSERKSHQSTVVKLNVAEKDLDESRQREKNI